MSDHFSGPAVMRDPSADITDFFAFPSPERPGNLVLVMDVFPMATAQSLFSDVVTHRFRLRPLSRSGSGLTHGTAEYTIDVTFDDASTGGVQKGRVMTADGQDVGFTVGQPYERNGRRRLRGAGQRPVLHGCRGRDPHRYLRQIILRHGREHRPVSRRPCDRVEVPFAPIVEQFNGATLIAAIAETVVTRRGNPIRTRACRAPGDQERHHGEPDPRSAFDGRRASRPL